MSELEEPALFETGPPTPEEAAAIRAAIRAAGGPELPEDAPMIVGRVHTAADLRADAEAIAQHFERPHPPGGCSDG